MLENNIQICCFLLLPAQVRGKGATKGGLGNQANLSLHCGMHAAKSRLMPVGEDRFLMKVSPFADTWWYAPGYQQFSGRWLLD